jgi:thiol-disulfide isomerase/thioredoxin
MMAQSDIKFQDISLQEAFARSKTENKLVFFMAFASWCPHCNKMMKEVFTDPTVADFYNSHFICIKKDMEKDDGIELHEKYKVKGYPTFIFFDSTGTTLYRMGGESNAETFIEHGKSALTPERQLPYLKQQFESDSSNSEKCYAYVVALKRGAFDLNSVMQQYLATKNDSELLNEINWKILSNGITDINSPYFKFILDHQKEYSTIASPSRVQRKIFYTVKQQLETVLAANDTINYIKLRNSAASIQNQQVDSLLFTMDITLYEFNRNWNAYQTETLLNTKNYAWNNADLLTRICETYLKNITDSSAVAQAAIWSSRALELNASYSNYILAAKLFQKSGNFPQALKMAQQAKNMAKQNGWDFSEADKLLNEMNHH